MGESEAGKCEVCGKENVGLRRKYYYYNITCECCGGDDHFEFIRHCNDCTPKPPIEIRPTLEMKPYRERN